MTVSVTELDPDFAPGGSRAWDAWVPEGQLSLSHGFLQCARLVEMEGFQLAPLALTADAGHRVGIAISFRNTIDAADLGRLPATKLVRLLRRIAPRFLKYDAIEVGIPAAQGLPLRAAVPALEAATAGAEWALATAERRRAPLVIVRDIDETAAPAATAALERLGFQRWPIPAGFALPLAFDSFSHYQANLRSPYRRRLTRCLDETRALTASAESEFAALAPELATLWLSVFDRADRYKRVVLPPAFFRAASALVTSRALLLRRSDGSIAAFALLLVDGPVLRFHCTGFKREAAFEEGVYFRLLYEIVRYGIESGCKAVDLGITAGDAKTTIGAVPTYRHAWLWLRSRWLRRLAALVTTPSARTQPIVQRNVFRNPVASERDPAFAE
jgi:hypothetical protein